MLMPLSGILCLIMGFDKPIDILCLCHPVSTGLLLKTCDLAVYRQACQTCASWSFEKHTHLTNRAGKSLPKRAEIASKASAIGNICQLALESVALTSACCEVFGCIGCTGPRMASRPGHHPAVDLRLRMSSSLPTIGQRLPNSLC